MPNNWVVVEAVTSLLPTPLSVAGSIQTLFKNLFVTETVVR